MRRSIINNSASSSFWLCLLLLVNLFAGCAETKTSVKDFDGREGITRTDVKVGVKPEPDSQVAVISTVDYGDIVVELYPNIAPQMVERFKKLIQEKFYDGTTFHRINAESGLIQGGDPLSRDDDPGNDGTGDSSYPNIAGEFSDIPFDRGTLGAARQGASPEFAGHPAVSEEQARNTGNCQFFITLRRVQEFDEDYTVFGRVISGIGNAEVIMRAPVAEESEQPADKIVIKSITLAPRNKYEKR